SLAPRCIICMSATPLLFTSFSPYTPTATSILDTLSLHDALPISSTREIGGVEDVLDARADPVQHTAHGGNSGVGTARGVLHGIRSEEHTSELQSRENLVCRLLPEKKKKAESGAPFASTAENTQER